MGCGEVDFFYSGVGFFLGCGRVSFLFVEGGDYAEEVVFD